MHTPFVYAQEGQAIGRVLSTSGSVTARDLSGSLRELSRRSDIFVGDTVITGPNGFAQLRMVDSAQISFKEDTEFTFSEYSSDGPGGAADNALMEMVRGGFRTISGTIGDDPADAYQVTTQFASIGIRGTTHEAVIDAGSLLTGVYDGGTTISNGQGSLDTGEGANFNYSQTFPGQAPRGLLQQPAQLGNINLNGGGDDNGDDGDDDDGDGNNDQDGDANDDGNDQNNDGNDDAGNEDNDNGGGGIADANDQDAGARGTGNQPNNPAGNGLADLGNNTNIDPTLDTQRTTEQNINPVIDVRSVEDFEETGTGTIENNFIQPSTDFLALVANSGFNTDFSLSELQGVTGRFSEVLAFNGLADTGGLSAAAVGDNGPTASITSLTMSFDLDFSANLAQVSNGFLGIRLDNVAVPIDYKIYFDGSILNSQSDFTIGSNSIRFQGGQITSINLQTSFLNSILVDNGVEQALFSDFFFEDTQGLGVEGQALVGFATPVLSPADRASVADRVGFILSRNEIPGAILPGNVTPLEPGQNVLFVGNDLTSPYTVDAEPPYIFRGAGGFLDFTDGTITEPGERPYDFEIGVWGSSQNPITLYEDFVDNNIFEQITDPLIIVSVDPAPIASLTGSSVYLSNFDRILGGSSQGNITQFFTAFNVDFTTALISDGSMEFCIGGDISCSGNGAQFWNLDYSGSVIEGYVVATPVNNTGEINGQLASIFGLIEGVFTGDNAEAFVGGFNLYYDDNLDIYRNAANPIPDTTVDGVFLIEKDLRIHTTDFDQYLNYDSFLVQEGYARILLGYTDRPENWTQDNPFIFVDSRSRPRLALTLLPFGPGFVSPTFSQQNKNLPEVISEIFDLDWERWEGPLLTYSDNLDLSQVQEGSISDVAFSSTFRISDMQDVTGHYNRVLGFIGEDNSGSEISGLEMSFDIDFNTSFNNIQNGIMAVSVADSAEEWFVYFEGSLLKNVVEFEFFDANPNALEATVVGLDAPGALAGIYVDGVRDAAIDFGDSNMQGVIIDDDRNTPALLSSFYFREDIDGPGRSITGQSLVARTDPRLDMFGDINTDRNLAIVNIPFFNETSSTTITDEEAFSLNPSGLNNRAYGVPGDVLRSNDYDVLFLGVNNSDHYYFYKWLYDYPNYLDWLESSYEDYFTVDFLQTVSEHADFAHFDENTFLLTSNSFELDMGFWEGSIGLFELGAYTEYDPYTYYDEYEANSCGSSDFHCYGIAQEGFESPAFWLNYSSYEFPYYFEGSFSRVLEAFGGFRLIESNGNFIQVPLASFTADLKVDLYYGGISGLITAISETNSALNAPLSWTAEFDYDSIIDPIDSMYNPASFAINSADGSLAGVSESSVIFDLAGSEDLPILVGSIQSSQDLSSGGSIGFASIFAARESQTGLVVESADAVNPGSVLFGQASAPRDIYSDPSTVISPRIGLNFDQNGQQNINNLDLNQSFDLVITGDSSVTDVSDDMYLSDPIQAIYDDAVWGYWDSANMSIVHNQGNNTIDASDDILWATFTPISDFELADMTGIMTYYGYDAIGIGTLPAGNGDTGVISSFDMAFGVNFDTGAISGGSMGVGLDGNPYADDWTVSFDGAMNGAFMEMSNITGTFNGAPILGDIKGALTSPYDGIAGFSLHNNMGDFLNGIGEFGVD